ncbi:MAG: DUF429 domain-containing protein [Actinomycetota bacterium]|nr:DUF429 domain-containing protein [Actinomycetota bacterium]
MGDPEELVLGVDGCPGGAWIGALVRGRSVEWQLFPNAAGVVAVDAAVVAIDIPIGLPEPGVGFRRGADLAAREFLRPWAAANSVFLTPVRSVVEAETFAEANALSRRLTGYGLSMQTWNITDRIAAVDEVLGDPADARVIEVHPEVSFRLSRPGSMRRSAPRVV